MSENQIVKSAHYLTFELDNEPYAFEIEKVQSVLDFENITRVPRTPPFMRGVINLRGQIVPVIDLRLKFGLSETKKTRESCIIIVELEIDEEKNILGVLADSVHEVISLDPEQIEPAPKIGTHLKTKFIKGVAKYQEQLIIILEMEKIFTTEELLTEELLLVQETREKTQEETEPELVMES